MANYIFLFRKVKNIIAKIMCMTYRAGGMSVVVKGRQASRSQAPILVIAPHSTFLDAVIVYVTGFPSIIVRKESGSNPWLGSQYLYGLQLIYIPVYIMFLLVHFLMSWTESTIFIFIRYYNFSSFKIAMNFCMFSKYTK